MTFAAYETSIQSGAPIELYEFTVGPTVYRYTTAPDDYTYQTKVYKALQITRSDIEESGELSKNELTVTAQRDLEVADLFRVAPPSEVVGLNIYRIHYDDPAQERKLHWTGRVLSASWSGPQTSLTCESIFTSLRRPGLRRNYGRLCPHVLYGAACGLADTSWRSEIVLTASTEGTVTATEIGAQADGWWSGGMIEWESAPGRYERRAIRNHSGQTVTLTHPIPGLAAGETIFIWPGCDHSLTTCGGKFANHLNYGGFPYVPKKNPFGSNSVF